MSKRRKNPPFHRHVFHALGQLRGAGEELPPVGAVERGVGRGLRALQDRIGGPARVQIVVLLAAVLALSSADTGAIGAVAPKLETTLGIGNVSVGLLVTVPALAAATGMLPVGWITDRMNRTRMVTAAVALWGVAEIVSAFSPDYGFLLGIRVALGALTAVTGPTLASLTGDLFPAAERSAIYGYILTGELLGAGFGLLVAGLVSGATTWRVGLAVLCIPSFFLAWELRRRLPEPARGGQSRLERGAAEVVSAEDVGAGAGAGAEQGAPEAATTGDGAPGGATEALAGRDEEETEAVRQVEERGIDPRRGIVLDRDPLDLGWWESFRYVVAVRSNLTLIVGSALGYFFLGGVETFALIYLEGHYGIGQTLATLIALGVGAAAIAGAILGGRTTDLLLRRGRIDARFLVPAAAFALAIVAFVPAAISTALAISVPLYLVAGLFIAAPNPGLDAARLDVMPSRMWGRGEAVRSFLRSILQAFAPLIFGVVSTIFGGRAAGFSVSGFTSHEHHGVSSAGLEQTFLVMLVALGASVVIVWLGRSSYATDVAAAAETERRFPATPGTSPDRGGPASRSGDGPPATGRAGEQAQRTASRRSGPGERGVASTPRTPPLAP